MPITDMRNWNGCVATNSDPYGKACVDTARRVMEILDAEPGAFNCHELMCRADKEVKAGGLTGYMAGAVASMISQIHSRGDEFRRVWNLGTQIGNEGEKANDSGGVLNPAVLNIDTDVERD